MYTFQRGEDVKLMLEAVGAELADLAIVESIDALIKKVAGAGHLPANSAPVAASFTSEAVEAQGDVGAGWLLTLDATQSAALTPGFYATNAILTLAEGGGVEITDPLTFRIVASI